MAQSGPEPAKRKERDFILLSEFAEIRHGPQPIYTIPDGGEGGFDTSSFSVRIFSTDFQQGQSEEFSMSPDSQVLLTETNDGLFAYVHYFALNDIEARGYMRQYCLSYLTASPSKLIDNFQRIKKDFSEVTSLFKCGNHKVFRHDLSDRLKDIDFSLDELNEDKQRVEDNSLYNGCYEDIPEMNKGVLERDREFTKKILDTVDFEMQSEDNKRFHDLIKKCDSNDVVRKRGNSNFYTTASFTQSVHKPKRIMAHLSQRFTRQQRTLNELSSLGYELAINTLKSLFEKYCRSEFALRMEQMESELLNPLSSLLTVGRVPMINFLKSAVSPPLNYKIISSSDQESLFQIRQQLKFNSSSLLNNEDCSSALLYLDPLPRQRMVSVVDPLGTPHERSLVLVDPRYSRHSYDPRQPIKEDPYENEDSEYHENSDTNTRIHNGIYHQYDNDRDDPTEREGSPSNYAHQSNERVSSSYNTPDPIPSPTPDMGEIQPYATPPQINHIDVIKRLSDGRKDHELLTNDSAQNKECSNSLIFGSKDSSQSELTRSFPQSKTNSQSAPPNKLDLHHSFDESSNAYYTPAVPYPQAVNGTPFHPRTSGIFNNHEGYPFVSSVHLIESPSPHKPGKELVTLFKDVPELRDILYCLLIGRPFAIIASQRDEKLVRRHIRALWLFVAGYSSHHQVIPWQEEQFDIDQLVDVRLVGICKPTIDRDPPIPPHLERHVSYWDWTTNTLSVPTYTGSLLNPILTRTRDKKNEELFMSLIESILLELALKAYVYYHGHCLQSELIVPKPMSPVEASPRKIHTISVNKDKVQFFSKLPMKESDINIVEYFTRVISEQQLSELTREGSNRPQKVVLKGHNCSTRVCKPKRLT